MPIIVLRTGRRKSGRVPRWVFGIPFADTAVPIVEAGRVVGCLSVARPVDMEVMLQGMAGKMSSAVESVASGASGFAASAGELAATSSELARNTKTIADDVKGMDAIIRLIMQIASQTNLLGPNAAIEASRAGDSGRVQRGG